MLDLKTLKVNGKVRVVNIVDNNVGILQCVNIGDVGIVKRIDRIINKVQVVSKSWDYAVWYFPHQLENVSSQSEDLIIYKSRWNEIIEKLRKPLNCMTDEELMIVQSVLKTNIPFNVVDDSIVVDIVIEKEAQTHLDANFVGASGNSSFYYRSDILKKWFYWGEDFKWKELFHPYNNTKELLPVSFGEKK